MIAVLYAIATGCSYFLVERLGRRRLLMWLSGALSVACVGVAISSGLESERSALIPGIVATIFMTLYFIAFGLGWVAVPWLYPPEINSLSMRTIGAGSSTACNWFFNFLGVLTTPIGMEALHWGIYLIYAALNAIFIPVIYFLVVETAGLSLEEIDRWFEDNPGWLVHKAKTFSSKDVGGEAMDEEHCGLVREDGEANESDGDALESVNEETDFSISRDSDDELD
jgi:hypothetical protein